MNALEHALAFEDNAALEAYLLEVDVKDFRRHVAEIEQDALKEGTDKAIIKDAIEYLHKYL